MKYNVHYAVLRVAKEMYEHKQQLQVRKIEKRISTPNVLYNFNGKKRKKINVDRERRKGRNG